MPVLYGMPGLDEADGGDGDVGGDAKPGNANSDGGAAVF